MILPVIIFALFFISCASIPGSASSAASQAGSGDLSGIYVFSQNDFIIFSGNIYVLNITDATYMGTYRMTGNNRFILEGHNSRTNWIRGTWVIIDSNTIRDADNDLWSRQDLASQEQYNPEILSSTYYYGPNLYISLNGNNFSITGPNGTETGIYIIVGNSLIFSLEMFGSNVWEIVNQNTLRDPEGDVWRRQ